MQGRGLNCTENIRGVRALDRTAFPFHPKERDTTKFQGESLGTLLPQDETVAFTQKTERSLEVEIPGPWGR